MYAVLARENRGLSGDIRQDDLIMLSRVDQIHSVSRKMIDAESWSAKWSNKHSIPGRNQVSNSSSLQIPIFSERLVFRAPLSVTGIIATYYCGDRREYEMEGRAWSTKRYTKSDIGGTPTDSKLDQIK